ncbi:TIGR03943 family protein [Streptomyces sp. FXJ1.172]|uniref:TIGR03943 family putative permease subunit n=1 Tax=Streptomyces sp. FXJ1.172 TaxID=710705 RepID=UPI0007D022F7|nr:TIGR03943 family protein [Streptomyces sp. FXJ1.172]WEO99399.1 TIGR03943 family protein [Streptomyces sp. FXJ1.172]
MKRPVQTLLLALTGIGLLHAALFTDIYLRYVKAGLRPLLIASGAVLLLLGLASAVVRDGRRQTHDAGHGNAHGHGNPHDRGRDHGHDHSGAPRIAWLLFLPALSLLFYAPPALGAYTAARSNTKPVTVQKGFAPLPATSPLPLTLTDFTKRVQQDRSRAIKNHIVQLTGFVTPAEDGDGWYLTRIIFTCCAADSQTVKVRVYGTEAPSANTWLAVTGTWHPQGTLGTKTARTALDAKDVRPIAQPVNAYTDDLPLTPS